MARYLVFDFEPNDSIEADSGAKAIGKKTRAEVGHEYVVIDIDDMKIEWYRGASAVYNRDTREVEGTTL